MRQNCIWVLIIIFTTPAVATEQACSFAAIDAYLKAEQEKYNAIHAAEGKPEKGGLVSRRASCLPRNMSGMLEAVDSYQSVPVNKNVTAILIDTEQCGGGNKHGQYLIFSNDGKCEVVIDPEIGDMKFIAKEIYANDKGVVLKGLKWTNEDPHCCPSKQGVLEYNVSTGAYRFTIERLKQ